ncbi:MAG TPA: PIN domain-containing protein [Candidatus Angelobacter sp.]|nr:PIN domain-containing protein [Candidatus Angelobacter sp.]
MILVDSSAWIEFLRDTGSPACDEVDRLLDRELALTELVLMEVLAGARDDGNLHQLRGLLGRARMVHCLPGDLAAAAAPHRQCRRQGATERRLIDCLIAARGGARGHARAPCGRRLRGTGALHRAG